jgi:hypothetical protein
MNRIDARIESLEAQLAAQQRERGRLMQQAWRRAEEIDFNNLDVQA